MSISTTYLSTFEMGLGPTEVASGPNNSSSKTLRRFVSPPVIGPWSEDDMVGCFRREGNKLIELGMDA